MCISVFIVDIYWQVQIYVDIYWQVQMAGNINYSMWHIKGELVTDEAMTVVVGYPFSTLGLTVTGSTPFQPLVWQWWGYPFPTHGLTVIGDIPFQPLL